MGGMSAEAFVAGLWADPIECTTDAFYFCRSMAQPDLRRFDLIDRLAAFGAGAGVFADVARPAAAWAAEGDAVLEIGFLWEDQLFQNVQDDQGDDHAPGAK